jgi:hypothetical protein
MRNHQRWRFTECAIIETMPAVMRQTPRVLLLIPSYMAANTAEQAALGLRPRANYHVLQRLGADILDYTAVDAGRLPAVAKNSSFGRMFGLLWMRLDTRTPPTMI